MLYSDNRGLSEQVLGVGCTAMDGHDFTRSWPIRLCHAVGNNVTFVTHSYGMSPGERCMCGNVKLTHSTTRTRLSGVIILYLEVKCKHLRGLTILHDQANLG